jgi:hypothetical protein
MLSCGKTCNHRAERIAESANGVPDRSVRTADWLITQRQMPGFLTHTIVTTFAVFLTQFATIQNLLSSLVQKTHFERYPTSSS